MAKLIRLLKSAGIYFLGNVMTRRISFFLLPIYTSYIVKADMGYFDVSTSYLNILVPVLCLEIWSGIMRFMFDFDDPKGKYKVIFNGMVIFTTSVAVYTLIFVALGFVANIQAIILVFFYGVFLMIQNLYTYLARGLGHNQAFAISGIVSSLVNSLSNIFMILVLGMRLESLYIAMILGRFAQFLILESRVKVLRNISFKMFDWTLIKSMARFSLPLCLNSACFWFLSSYNKVGISNTLGLNANGIYTVAGKFTMMVAIFANCFSLAWQEMVYSVGNEKENKGQLYSTASNYCLTLLMFGTLLILPVVHVAFPILIDKAYSDAYPLVPLYMFATAISTFSSFLGNIFGAEKKTGIVFYSTVIAAVVKVAMFHLLVGQFGLEAANIGLTLGYIVNIIMRVVLLKRSFPIKLDYIKIAIVFLLNIPIFYIYFTQSTLVNILAFFGVLIIMLIMFYKPLLQVLSSLKGQLTKRNS